DEPELDHRYEIVQLMETDAAATLIEAMSADQQADLFRGIRGDNRDRLLAKLNAETRHALTQLLRYRAESAGGIMTTEVLTVPSTWTVEQTLPYIRRVARNKETVYVIYLLDDNEHLIHVVSLRQLMVAERLAIVHDVGDRRHPVHVAPETDREEVARVIAKYNLLAVP